MKLDGIWIGDLDRKILIESPTEVKSAITGQVTYTWATFLTMWANRQQDSKESIEANKQVANDTGSWVIRYATGVNETMRVNDHGDIHYIKGIRVVDRDSLLVLMTEKRDG